MAVTRRARDASGGAITLVPLRLGTRAIGLLAAGQDGLDPGTLDAIAGLAAIAVERTQFLAERKAADLVRQRADLASTLLASHQSRSAYAAHRRQRRRSPMCRTRRCRPSSGATRRGWRRRNWTGSTRIFRDILDMARIDASALTLDRDG